MLVPAVKMQRDMDVMSQPYLALAFSIQGKQVIQGSVVDASTLILLNVCACHGVSLARACLPVRKDAHIVACRCICNSLRTSDAAM